MKIAIDFDGTCVEHAFPKVGNDIGAVPVLKALVANGHQLILFTMRSDRPGEVSGDVPPEIEPCQAAYLTDAVNWFKDNDIPLYGIQKDPGQDNWTSSPKCYAQLYIDDAALGIPIVIPRLGERPYVDWIEVESMLTAKGIL